MVGLRSQGYPGVAIWIANCFDSSYVLRLDFATCRILNSVFKMRPGTELRKNISAFGWQSGLECLFGVCVTSLALLRDSVQRRSDHSWTD